MARTGTFLCVKTAAKPKIFDLAGFNDVLAQYGVGEEFQLAIEEMDAHHSRLQESGFHAMISPWAKEGGHKIADLKRDLLAEIFGLREHVDVLTGVVVLLLVEPHTSKLSKKKYNELIERTLEIAARMGHVLEAPNEYKRRKAKERQRRAA